MENINLKNTLIAEIIQLFALMASADGKVTTEEKTFIKKYFDSLYPENFAQVLYLEFEKAVQSGIKTDSLLTSIHRRLNTDDKLFLLIKLIELMATDEIDESERKVLNTISGKFHIPIEHTQFLIELITGDSGENISSPDSPFKFLLITGVEENGDVLLPFVGLKLLVLNIGKSLILVQIDSRNDVVVSEKPIVEQFSTRIPHNGSISINNEFEISYQDLKYYFKNTDAGSSTYYLSESNEDIEICETVSDDDVLVCEHENCRTYLTPVKESQLLVNGAYIKQRILVNFNDKIFWGNYKINLRTLIFQSAVKITEKTKLSFVNIKKFSVGNNLESTIHIEDDSDMLWDCQVELIDKSYFIDVRECPYNVYVNDKKVSKKVSLDIEDKIRIRNSIISYNPATRVFEKKDAGINIFEARGINYQFNDSTLGVSNLSFSTRRGELLGIMGTSGCGKSTLLNILNGFYKPQKGNVLADGYDIHSNLDLLSSYMSYVPQDDLLFENLTVYENLYYNAKLRFPGADRNIRATVDKVLHDIGLYEKRNLVVGSPLNKILSGGERKRVNIGLELLADSHIILLDEPTSGLSSKDSERILKLLQNLTFQGKIIYVVIHQPSIKLFELFNKLILLDKGGKLAYFGSPFGALDYFKKYTDKSKTGENETSLIDPDFLLDTLEQQISDIDGTPLPIRKFSPDFWQEEFKNHLKELTKSEKRKTSADPLIRKEKSIKDHFSVALTLLQRNFVNKLRDKSNLVITFLLPPLLGLFVGAILHYTPGEGYTFFENKHIGTFLFLSVLISVFLGITNSVEEIIKDQNILFREKMLKISNVGYLNSKIITLIPFALIQNFLFVSVGYFVLEGKEFYLVYTIILSLVSFCGISLGLFISSIPKLTSKAAVNIIPIILIPQIVFGGALIQYQEMNKQLVFYANSPVPEICQLMPSRWGFESMVTYLANNNSYQGVEDLKEELISLNNSIKETDDELKIESLLEQRSSIRAEIDEFKSLYHDTHGNLDISQAIKIDGNLEYKNFIEGKTSVYPMFMGRKTLPLINKEVSTPLYNSFMLLFMSIFINIMTLVVLRLRFK